MVMFIRQVKSFTGVKKGETQNWKTMVPFLILPHHIISKSTMVHKAVDNFSQISHTRYLEIYLADFQSKRGFRIKENRNTIKAILWKLLISSHIANKH